jgi:Flp pilus assembly protein TadG
MTMQQKKKFPGRQAGVALVEFALGLPLLMMLLVGLIEVGRLAWFNIQVGNAAHAGAQYGATPGNGGDLTGMQTIAESDAQNGLTGITAVAQNVCSCWNGTASSPATPAASACGVACTNGGRQITYVQVTATGTLNSLFNYTAFGLPRSWSVTRVALIRAVPN